VGALSLCLVNDRPDARLLFTPAAWPGVVFRRCAAVPLGFPPICAVQGHGGERLMTGSRPLQGRRTCAGGTAKKGAVIRSPGRFLAAGHGLTAPPCKVGGYLAVVFGVTIPSASLLLAASDARSVCGLTHPARLSAVPIAGCLQ